MSLKQAIDDSGHTIYGLAQITGISQSVLHRFVDGERDITLETAGKIAAALGAELKVKKPRSTAR